MGQSDIDESLSDVLVPELEDGLLPQQPGQREGPDRSLVMANENDTKREPVWPVADSKVRPLTEEEIERLEHRLGRPVDRNYLIDWVSQAIKDVVRLWGDPAQPTRRQRRDSLLKIAREGRRWIKTIDASPGLSALGPELDNVKCALARLCHRAELFAKEIRVKGGNPRSSVAALTVIERLIGIAKAAKVYPSSEGRALRSQTAPRDPPDFYLFVDEALEIAGDVIESSPLPEEQKYAALSALEVPTRGALSKLIEQARGLIGDYRESEHGLVSWPMCDPNPDEPH